MTDFTRRSTFKAVSTLIAAAGLVTITSCTTTVQTEPDVFGGFLSITPQMIETNGIEVGVYDAGDGPPVVLLHGFPAVSASLRYQFDALVENGYRAIAIDQRGFGVSDTPEDVNAYAMSELTDDIAGVIDALDLNPVFLVGHDWGGAVTWRVALDHPDKVRGVVSLGTFLVPRPDSEPIALRRAQFGDDNYVVRFQDPAITELLDADVSRSIDFFYRKNPVAVADYPTSPDRIRNFELVEEFLDGDWVGDALALTPAGRDAHIAAFERTGFGPGLNWYRNATRNWEDRANLPAIVTQPSLILSGKDDYLAPPAFASLMDPIVPNLTKAVVDGGHWYPLESPQETNQVLLSWLAEQIAKE